MRSGSYLDESIGIGRGAIWRRILALRPSPLARSVFVAWLATRAGYVLITYMANKLHLFPTNTTNLPGWILSWQRWDVNWYLIVSRLGYDRPQGANFFPLFPGAMGGISWLLGDGSGPIWPQPDRIRVLVGLGLSNLGLLVGLYAIARLANLDRPPEDEDAGVRAVWITLAYPFAVSWTAPMAEGLFLAFAALTFWLARTGRWYAAAFVAFLAALTRPLAIALILPLAWEFARQQGWLRLPSRTLLSMTGVRRLAKGTVVVGAVPLGFSLFFGYLYVRFGDFLLPLHTQMRYWGHVSMPQWRTFQIAVHRLLTIQDTGLLATEIVLVVTATLIVIVRIRRLPVAYTLYMAGLLYLITAAPVPTLIDLMTGPTRYLASAIPIFLVLTSWTARRSGLQMSLIAVGMILQGALTIAWFQSSPVA